jgi:hypothetical protein
MINDLPLALAMSDRFRERELVVSEKVFFEVLSLVSADGVGDVQLNILQADSQFLLHKVRWQGRLFIHFSSNVIGDQFAKCSS